MGEQVSTWAGELPFFELLYSYSNPECNQSVIVV